MKVLASWQADKLASLRAGAVFHRPHPGKEADKGTLKSMRRFLVEAGVKP